MPQLMIRTITLFSVLLLFGISEGAQQIPKSFSHLSKLNVDIHPEYTNNMVRFEQVPVNIFYDPKISKKLKKHMIEPTAGSEGAFRVLETKLDSSNEGIYVIDYSNGPSSDPVFYIYQKVAKTFVRIGSFAGTELIIPGDGFVYVSGVANDFFNKRRKYYLKDEILKEVTQPYYYVGMKTTNIQPLDIFTDKTYQVKVAHLPSNTDIEVLLASKNTEYEYDYLIKSPYGLIGWTNFEGRHILCGAEIIKGICFHGD